MGVYISYVLLYKGKFDSEYFGKVGGEHHFGAPLYLLPNYESHPSPPQPSLDTHTHRQTDREKTAKDKSYTVR